MMLRRWDVRLGIALLVVAALAMIWVITTGSGQVKLQQALPTPTVTKVQTVAPSPEPSAVPTSPSPVPVVIPSGIPTKIYIPDAGISTEVQPMPTSCQDVIDPPSEGVAMTQIYACGDFALPGTDSTGFSIITGHSSPYQDTQLNKLNDQEEKGTLVAGERIMIQTATSGGKWLIYGIKNVYEIPKPELPYDARVWGTPGESTSGRLLIVTCRVAKVVPAPKNLVVVAELEGISD